MAVEPRPGFQELLRLLTDEFESLSTAHQALQQEVNRLRRQDVRNQGPPIADGLGGLSRPPPLPPTPAAASRLPSSPLRAPSAAPPTTPTKASRPHVEIDVERPSAGSMSLDPTVPVEASRPHLEIDVERPSAGSLALDTTVPAEDDLRDGYSVSSPVGRAASQEDEKDSRIKRKSSLLAFSADTGGELNDRFRELREEFRTLCDEDARNLTIGDLFSKCHARQDPKGAFGIQTRARYAKAMAAFNEAAEVVPWPGSDIVADTYICLKQADRAWFKEHINDAETVKTIEEIRLALQRLVALKQVEMMTGVGTMADDEEITGCRWFIEAVFRYLEPVMGFVVFANAIVIGISADVDPDWEGWNIIQGVFAILFGVEILLKWGREGPFTMYFSSGWLWNFFDTGLVVTGLVDFGLTAANTGVDLSSITVLRLLRFAKLGRLIRVLRMKIFKEVTMLIVGCIVGMRTLFWAVVLLSYFIYMLGVMMRQTIGSDAPSCQDTSNPNCSSYAAALDKYRKDLFGSVPRSMFTTYRCFTDGCSSIDGTPLTPYLWDTYGPVYVAAYVATSVFVVFGLFNLIAAIFVENTLESARADEAKRRTAMAAEQARVARKLEELLVMFCTGEKEEKTLQKKWSFFSSPASSRPKMEGQAPVLTQKLFERVLLRPKVQEILNDLEIPVSGSPGNLFEILDADGSGSIEVKELVQGLMKLRAGGEKTDLVAVLIAVQSLKKSVKVLENLCLQQQETVGALADRQEQMHTSMRDSAQSNTSSPMLRPPDVAALAAELAPVLTSCLPNLVDRPKTAPPTLPVGSYFAAASSSRPSSRSGPRAHHGPREAASNPGADAKGGLQEPPPPGEEAYFLNPPGVNVEFDEC